jgi:hypothetical protein
MEPVKIGKWIIKASTTNLESICLLFHDTETHDFLIRYFTNEIEANLFVERLVYDSESENPSSDTL